MKRIPSHIFYPLSALLYFLFGLPVSLSQTKAHADTTGKKYRGSPVLIDGGEQYNGSTISYNFKNQKGKITLAQTEIEKGYYRGEDIKKVEKDVLFVENGRYTKRDRDDPP